MTAKTKPASKPATKTATIRRKGSDADAERLRRTLARDVKATIAANEKAVEDAKANASPTPATPASAEGQGGKKDKAPKVAKLAKSAAGGGAAKQLGGLDAAAIVLKKAGVPMTCKEMWAKIDEQKMWFTEGKTPEATIYSAILREIKAKGKDARFRKAARGKFEFCGTEG